MLPILALLTLPLLSHSSSFHLPNRYKLNQKQTECLYDRFDQGDLVAFSVFVVEALMNGRPLVNVNLEGPFMKSTQDYIDSSTTTTTDSTTTLGRKIRQGLLDEWRENKSDISQILEWHVKVDWTHAGEADDAMRMQGDERQNNRQNQQQQQHQQHAGVQRIVQTKIEPYQITQPIPTSGYYRLCARAELHQLIVEMDIRSKRRMGGVDRNTGHVYTFAQRELLREEAALDNNNNNNGGVALDTNTYQSELEELSKILVNQVEDADLTKTKEQVKELNAKTTEMMIEIQNRMTRIRSHELSARRNNASLAWSSKMETLLFALISGFQVYTMRKWLLSNTLLGR